MTYVDVAEGDWRKGLQERLEKLERQCEVLDARSVELNATMKKLAQDSAELAERVQARHSGGPSPLIRALDVIEKLAVERAVR